MSYTSDSANKTKNKPELPSFPQADMDNISLTDIEKIDKLIDYIDKVRTYLEEVQVYINNNNDDDGAAPSDTSIATSTATNTNTRPRGNISVGITPPGTTAAPQVGGKKKQRKTKKKGGADIDYSKVYNVQGLIENISKSTGKDPITSQSIPAPFSTGSPLQRLGKKEAKSLPNELKNEIIPDYSQDGGKKKKTEKKKMPKKK